MDMLINAMRGAQLQARQLYMVNPNHPLIPLLESTTKGDETNWDKLISQLYEKYHRDLNLSKLNDQVALWGEIAGLLEEAVKKEYEMKKKRALSA